MVSMDCYLYKSNKNYQRAKAGINWIRINRSLKLRQIVLSGLAPIQRESLYHLNQIHRCQIVSGKIQYIRYKEHAHKI